MAFCTSCGSPLKDATAFCGSCGAAVAVAGMPGAFAAPAPQTAALSSKTAAALAYSLTAATGLYFLLAEPYRRDAYIRFHALQAIFYYVAAAGLWTAYWLASSLLRFTSFGFSVWITLAASTVLSLVLFAYWLFLMYKAWHGESYKIPHIGRAAEAAAQSEDLPAGTAGFLTYVLAFVTGIVFLLHSRYRCDPFVRFHAFQSIFASVAYVAIAIVWSVSMGALLFTAPPALWQTLVIALLAFRAAACAGWFYLMREAYKGRRIAIPAIGRLAAGQAN